MRRKEGQDNLQSHHGVEKNVTSRGPIALFPIPGQGRGYLEQAEQAPYLVIDEAGGPIVGQRHVCLP